MMASNHEVHGKTDTPRSAHTATIFQAGALAVVRLSRPEDALAVADVLLDAGLRGIELTMTTPGAVDVMRTLRSKHGTAMLLGAGSVLTTSEAAAALDAGASFLVSPVFDPTVLALAHEAGAPAIPGAFTPTEMVTAYRAGADIVKLFPADTLGVRHLRAVLAPLPFLPVMPTGGVTPDNVAEWLAAGAVAVGLGSSLVDPALVRDGRMDVIAARARQVVQAVTDFRAHIVPDTTS